MPDAMRSSRWLGLPARTMLMRRTYSRRHGRRRMARAPISTEAAKGNLTVDWRDRTVGQGGRMVVATMGLMSKFGDVTARFIPNLLSPRLRPMHRWSWAIAL